jgi:hypothetical protein
MYRMVMTNGNKKSGGTALTSNIAKKHECQKESIDINKEVGIEIDKCK